MGWVVTTPAGHHRANWRDPAGRERSKTFPTKKAAKAYVAQVETAMNRGAYVDDRAGKAQFGPYAIRWLRSRSDEITTRARDASIMFNHVIPQWGEWPLARIGHSAVQGWVSGLARRLSPATVAECHRLFKTVMASAVRDRLIAFNPCEGVKVPRRRKRDTDERTISRNELLTKLLPALLDRYRALVALSAGTGLRWGECVGLYWSAADLEMSAVRVIRVAVEVSGRVSFKAFPKSRAGRRVVPLPGFAGDLLRVHWKRYGQDPDGLVFTAKTGEPVHRGTFRARVWRPSLVRAGLLGDVAQVGGRTWRAEWTDATGAKLTKEFAGYGEAVAHVARWQTGGLRFHDLRHSYATWLEVLAYRSTTCSGSWVTSKRRRPSTSTPMPRPTATVSSAPRLLIFC